jgi:multidrug efflux pump subunit AcrB
MIAPIHGVTLPTPAGGKYRQIMVDIDQTKLLAKGLTPLQVVNAVNAQNLTLSGTAIWCSRTSSGRMASARSCSALSKTAMPRH